MPCKNARAVQQLPWLLVILLGVSACTDFAAGSNISAGDSPFSPDRLKLLVTDDGLYGVTAGELAAAGMALPDPISHESLRLTDGEQIVPYLIKDDMLLFFGQASDSPYYGQRPYILQTGLAGQEMKRRSAPPTAEPLLQALPQTVRLEENALYTPEARVNEGDDVWFWSKLPQRESLDIEAVLPLAVPGPATLRVNAWGFTHDPGQDNDHDLDLLVNGGPVGSMVWDGQTHYQESLPLDATVLHDGINTITIDNSVTGTAELDIVQVNWLELDYLVRPTALSDQLTFGAADGVASVSGFSAEPTVLEVTDPADPQLLTGWSFENGVATLPVTPDMTVTAVGPRGLRKPEIRAITFDTLHNAQLQADLIIVTTNDLAQELEPLKAAREAEGLRVIVVPVEEIYDHFGLGAADPESIQAFVAYAYENWTDPRPRYLLLVGDATSDYRSFVSEAPLNVVPAPMVPVQYSGETVSDSRLVDVNGDGQPELAIGRWPVSTRQEVADLVQRTLAYEAATPSSRALFATDGSENTFRRIAERLVASSGLETTEVLQAHGPSSTEFSDLWQQGAWLTTYVGHGSLDQWGKDAIFSSESVTELRSEVVPIVLQLTCLTGLFSHPDQDSLVETMIKDEHGPVLLVAASSLTLSAHQEPFAVELLHGLQDTNIQRVGDAFLNAKQSLDIEHSDGLREISDTFALFGDPSAKIARP